MPLERCLSELLFTQNYMLSTGPEEANLKWYGYQEKLLQFTEFREHSTFAIYGVQGALTLLFMISSSETASGKCMEFVAGEPAQVL